MKFGMPTLIECKNIDDCVAVARKCGLDFVEINMSFPEYYPHNLDVDKIKELSAESRVGYTIHADEMLNPFDFNDTVSDCYFKVMKDTISFAKKIGATVINMHLLKGVYVTLPDKVVLLSDVYFEKYIEKVGQFVKMCEKEVGESNIKIAIENVDSNPFTESQLASLELFLGSPVFALTLDVGHEVCLGNKDTHVFKKYPDKIRHLHLHDSDGKKPHLALGDGTLDVIGKIKDFGGETCLLEVKTIEGLKKSVEYLKNKEIM